VFACLGTSDQREIIEDWLLDIEVGAELANNPISIRVSKLERQLPGICSVNWLRFPDVNKATSLKERRILLNNVRWYGSRCTIIGGLEVSKSKLIEFPGPRGAISETVWVPNFRSPFCSFTLPLAENLAKLIALEKVLEVISTSGVRNA